MFRFDRTEWGKALVCGSRNAVLINLILKVSHARFLDLRASGEQWRNLHFLRNVIALDGLGLGGGISLDSFDGIEFQRQLKTISLGALSTSDFNWEIFPSLDSVHTLAKFISPVFWSHLRVKSLGIEDDQRSDFDELNLMRSIVRLLLIRTNIRGLASLDLQGLRRLEIRGASRLASISGSRAAGGIEELRLIGCPNLEDLGGISEFINLKRLLVMECGCIESLRPLHNLELLQSVNFCGTRVADGRIRFLLNKPGLVELEFVDRKEYDLKRREIAPNWPSRS